MGIPGCYAAVLLAERMGCKRLNTYGFLLLSAAFAGQAIAWMLVPEAHILQFAPWFVLKSLIDCGFCAIGCMLHFTHWLRKEPCVSI